MKSLIILTFVLVSLSVTYGKSCKNEDDCNTDQCCAAWLTASMKGKGVCVRYGIPGEKCSEPESKSDYYGGKFIHFCPCQEGLACKPWKLRPGVTNRAAILASLRCQKDDSTTVGSTKQDPSTEPTKQDPSTEPTKDDPSTESTRQDPVTETTQEPVTESTTQEQVTESTTQEQVTESTTQELVTESTTQEQVTESTTQELATESTTQEPVTESTTQEPVTESTTQEPVTESTTTEEDEPIVDTDPDA